MHLAMRSQPPIDCKILSTACNHPEGTTQDLEKAHAHRHRARHQKGDFLVDYEEKVFEDVKAEPGEKALVTFHTVAFEGSIGLVNLLQATRLQRKGFETSVLLYGPGVTLGVQRGFPKLGDEAFPGHLATNNQIEKFMKEGGKVYACRFALQALYGHGEGALIPGIRPSRRRMCWTSSCCTAATTPSSSTPGRCKEPGR
jgi:uncharacterized repeat protein (TIGR04044 family)